MAERGRVTLSDVAAVAGVSLSTASRALNGGGRVSTATRSRIAEAARRLDFRPNALAQSFALGRSRTIGILARNARGAFTEPVLVGAFTHLGGREQACLLYDASFDPDSMADSVRRLQARRVDGLLVLGDDLRVEMRSVTTEFSVPVAYAYGLTDREGDSCYVPDSRMAGRLAGEHLLSLGRRRIAHITGEAADTAATGREQGLLTSLAEAGLPPATGTLRGDWSRAWGATACHAADRFRRPVRRCLLRQRPDRARRGVRPAGVGQARPGRCRAGRCGQLGVRDQWSAHPPSHHHRHGVGRAGRSRGGPGGRRARRPRDARPSVHAGGRRDDGRGTTGG